MAIIQMHEYEHRVLLTLGDMRERGVCFPCFNTINRELPDLNVARLSDCLEKLRWKGMIGQDDRQFRLTLAGVEEYQTLKRLGFK
jgi:hypothetical protein